MAGCGAQSDESDETAIVVGTTDRITALDPAAAWNPGSALPANAVYQYLLNYPPGDVLPRPDAADRCEFTEPTVYTCYVKPGLRFANGNPLTAASVKYSFDRLAKIASPDGPFTLYAGLERTDFVDESTVAFVLRTANDQSFPYVLASDAGAIVDEKVFPADAVLADDDIVAGKPFAGPYTITKYEKNEIVELEANPAYDGAQGKPTSPRIHLRYYGTSDALTTAADTGSVDVGYRSFLPADIEGLRDNSDAKVLEGPGTVLDYLTFNFETMPGGTPEQKWAVRKAIASSIDRAAIAAEIYEDTYAPAWSMIPEGFVGSVPAYRDSYGDKPNREAAAGFVAESGLPAPIPIVLEHSPDHYGPASSAEYEMLAAQLTDTGLFTVELKTADWATYDRERTEDAYPFYEHRWEAVTPDPDQFITPLIGEFGVLRNHFASPVVADLVRRESTERDYDRRVDLLRQLQDELARTHIPILPIVVSKQIAVVGTSVGGVQESLDVTGKLRLTTLTEN